jgi:murein DD-endopeptidase MepM/ murein hydrolase activator NlpD
VVVTVRERLKKISFTVAFGLVIGVLFTFLAFHFIDSPKEKMMKRELASYKRDMRQLNTKMKRAEDVLKDLENRDDNIYRTIFEVNPIHSAAHDYGHSWDSVRNFNSKDQLEFTNQRISALESRLYEQSLSYDKVFKLAKSQKDRLLAMPAIMPIAKGQCELVSGFGTRYHPVLRYSRPHTGVDLAARTGTPIYATADGTVTEAGRNAQNRGGYGVVCVVNHGFGYQTLYAHMIEVKARVGQKVKRGELIGWVGSTGLSSGSHLHYEVILNGRPVNPVYYFFNDLTPGEFEEILEAASQENQCLS